MLHVLTAKIPSHRLLRQRFPTILRSLNVPGYKPDIFSDMTSCIRHKCLYMSDYDNRCIHRYELARRATSKWSVPGKPWGMSVTFSCNLLVTCQRQYRSEPDKLVELSADSGECVREIALQLDIVYLHDSVQLPTALLKKYHGTTMVYHGVHWYTMVVLWCTLILP